jgi:uncharacterized protein YecE (DUF72 family)
MPLWIGTSGWQYQHWKGRLYPAGLPTDRWLDRYVEAFDTVELNVSFYRQPKTAVFGRGLAAFPIASSPRSRPAGS